jgi:lipid-binding SYLF domain-containing protein
MRNLTRTLAAFLLASLVTPLLAFEPNVNDPLQLDAQKAIIAIKKADPGIEAFFENAAGFAVFPSVGKGGFVIGGAYGKEWSSLAKRLSCEPA